MAKKKKKNLFSKFIVVSVITLNVIFAIAVLAIFRTTSCEPSSLIIAWFGFTTSELWALSGIKKNKDKAEYYNNNGL